ncbi:type III secretion system export apparatus subunit SctU [Pectobacteriaceae bacterium CE70]|uniref:EscU/YscU/HrcU family type III secretion system export apparatus switch protein n=1 Tax=Serratia sp. (strain ATCC 39006) TaxID=104623 RepID=A0A2I5T7Q6_SERS3|nr:type III secretion system export apparatus subunit SctU [Serratia sp. ATCC 39006]WJV60720.1 type III secretion system export apparatus subunit SctU [Pectobacteriaceae bacterium C52]WJV68838.1 type III secretion system export apparatus subunit SctU [Pectobacteriaceae bacterium CE70]WJY12761.1 type III secretion system export apparatus subunit SctU [Pectobacteriaceae bacterium C80]AUH00601.1 EscU/YscU/HrcU family type III secretion system export apparatus switch protein [Serratia sp. ATCC 3900
MSEKTEKPTTKKLQDARRKGEVGQSQDVPKLLICTSLLETILALADRSMGKLQSLMQLPLARLSDPFGHAAEEIFSEALSLLATFCLLTISVAVLLRLVGGWLQYGPLFAPEALRIDLSRLNPINQFKQMFSMRKLTEMLTNILKASTIGTIFYLVIIPDLESLAELSYGDLDGFWHGVAKILHHSARTTLTALLVLSALDFGLQKYFFMKQQRMSHEDLRSEHKDSEGDPHMKGHRKSLANEILNKPATQRPKGKVEDADLLLVNPTHYAVALFYRPGKTPLPRILCKGKDDQAKKLITRAHQADIPVIRFVWLARTLYRIPTGNYIPRDTLQAVAQVYRILRQLEQEQKREKEIIEIE